MAIFKCINRNISVARELLRKINAWRKTRRSIAAVFNHIKFLNRCKQENLTPKGFLRYVGVPVKDSNAVQQKIAKLLMKECQQENYRKLESLKRSEDKLRKTILLSLHPEDYIELNMKITEAEKSTFFFFRNKHMRKIDILLNNKPAQSETISQDSSSVINLSSREISDTELRLLRKGLKFIPTSTKINKIEAMAQVEIAMSKAKLTDETLPALIEKEINKNEQSKTNLSKAELKALNDLANDETIVIMPSDKGNNVVIINKSDYKTKLEDQILSDDYVKLKGDPTGRIDRQIRSIATSIKKTKGQQPLVIHKIIGHETRHPSVFGNIKTHKEGQPLRLILSNFGTVTQNAASFCKNILTDYVKMRDNGVILDNVTHLKEKMKNISEPINNFLLISMDVKNMYGSIDVKEASRIIEKIIKSDKNFKTKYSIKPTDFIKLIDIILQNSFFLYEDSFYSQKHGLPMGSCLSGVVADLVMQEVELKMEALSSFNFKYYYRYRDDYLGLWRGGTEDLEEFLLDLNQIHSTIKFTLELESNSSIPFLDARITKTEKGPFFTTYSKPCASNLTINFKSFHSRHIINSVITGEINRIMQISDDQNNDLEKLKVKLRANDFPEALINKKITTHKEKRNENSENSIQKEKRDQEIKATLKLKFWGKKSYKIKKTAKKFGIRTVFERPTNLQGIFARNYKPKNHCNKGLVYRINCGCQKSYVGETGGDIKKRIKEHIQSIKKSDPRNAFANHALICDNKIDWEGAETLMKEGKWKSRKYKEALLIRKLKPELNQSEGFILSGKWDI